ncbi:MAG: NAD-dependent epimerase/dehydratase family protein, partial [Actinomycetota bacterium]|nr:NAD-dependent epimerase/dehydratase family protein [Actinomycetota bacterium]
MRILVLGGTGWLGGEVARAGLADGHEVTCLARGESGSVPSGSRLVQGDRSDPDGYAALGTARWDLVVDVTRQPSHVRSALGALSDLADHWVFVSSGSVYADHSVVGAGRTTALLEPWPHDEVGFERYGERKVACEELVRAHRGSAALLARSGLIAGHGDPTDRFG